MSDATENTAPPDTPACDTFSRKWQLTFNNPKEHGWTHEKIREVLGIFSTLCYWCMADEIGGEQQTYHTHLFLNLAPSKCRFSTLKSKFPGAHIEKAFGTSRENRDYIMKDGKWKDNEKGTTSVESTFEEFGECPEETPGKSKETERILEMLKDGADNMEIVEAIPSAMKIIDKVFIITNVPPDTQYMNVDLESRNAFYRRIHRVIRFWDDGRFTEYTSVDDCKNATRWTNEADAAAALNFDQLSL